MSEPGPRILIVRPSALGDVARTVPALVSLKRAFPHARIDWLVNEAFADAVAHHPDLSEVVPFPRRRLARFGWSPSATREGLRFFAELRRRRYDAAYDLQGLGRSGWLTWVTGAPHRVGASDAREFGWLAYNKKVRIDGSLVHTVDRMLAVLEADGVPAVHDLRLYTPPGDAVWAAQWREAQQVEPGRYIVVAPGAAWASKRWPIDRFDALIDRLSGQGFDACAIVGAESERAQAAPLVAATAPRSPRRIDLIGQTTVGRLMAVIASAGLVIANDSAALHLAVGLGVRCVGLYGPTDPAKVGPYRYETGVVATSGSDRLNYRTVDAKESSIAGIAVEQVLEKVTEVMRASPPIVEEGAGLTRPR